MKNGVLGAVCFYNVRFISVGCSGEILDWFLVGKMFGWETLVTRTFSSLKKKPGLRK
jgi:hypothetical protein